MDDNEKKQYIKDLILNKDYDTKYKDVNGNVIDYEDNLIRLMYEFSETIASMLDDETTSKNIVDQLVNKMGTFRIGQWNEKDSHIKYGDLSNDTGMSVCSDEYKYSIKGCGAQTVKYYDNDDIKSGVVIFDDGDVDLENIDDMRQTAFHEWIHVLSDDVLTEKEILDKGYNIDTVNNDRKFVNAIKLKNTNKYLYNGISTKEFDKNGNRIMHNQIDDGMTECITGMIIKKLGKNIPNKGRYLEQSKIAEKLIEIKPDSFKNYLLNSSVLVNELIDDNDNLHYLSDKVNENYNNLGDKGLAINSFSKLSKKFNLSREQISEFNDLKFFNSFEENEENENELRDKLNDHSRGIIDRIRINRSINLYKNHVKNFNSFCSDLPNRIKYNDIKNDNKSFSDSLKTDIKKDDEIKKTDDNSIKENLSKNLEKENARTSI